VTTRTWSVSYTEGLLARIEEAGYSVGKGTMRRMGTYVRAEDEKSAYAQVRANIFKAYGLNVAPDEMHSAHPWEGVL